MDLYGLLFCEKVCRQLANRCSEYITGEGLEKLNEHDRIRSLTMITDLLRRKRLSGPIKGQFIVNSLEDEEESLQWKGIYLSANLWCEMRLRNVIDLFICDWIGANIKLLKY